MKFIKLASEMTMSVIFVYHMTFQTGFLYPLKWTLFNEKCIVVKDIVMTLLVPAESVNTCVVITLFMT